MGRNANATAPVIEAASEDAAPGPLTTLDIIKLAAVDEASAEAFAAKYDSLVVQIDGLAAVILELDLRGDEDAGACGVAAIRLRELTSAVSELTMKLIEATKPAEPSADDDTVVDPGADILVKLGIPADAGPVDMTAIAKIGLLIDNGQLALTPIPSEPVPERAVEKPKPGKSISLPKRRASAASVAAALEAGDVLVVVLTDVDGRVQHVPSMIAARDAFTIHDGGRLVFGRALAIEPEQKPSRVRAAFLLDAEGAVLDVCRLSADLTGGGGGVASIPAHSLVFNFDPESV